MDKMQEFLMLKLELKELNIKYVELDNLAEYILKEDSFQVIIQNGWFSKYYKIGEFIKGKYYMYGLPETNGRIIDIITRYKFKNEEEIKVIFAEDHPERKSLYFYA